MTLGRRFPPILFFCCCWADRSERNRAGADLPCRVCKPDMVRCGLAFGSDCSARDGICRCGGCIRRHVPTRCLSPERFCCSFLLRGCSITREGSVLYMFDISHLLEHRECSFARRSRLSSLGSCLLSVVLANSPLRPTPAIDSPCTPRGLTKHCTGPGPRRSL